MKKIRNSILAGIIFGLVIGIYLSITSKTDVAIFVAIFCTLTFSIISYFKIFSKIDYSVDFQEIDKNSIVYSGLANHIKSGISIGGTLYLLKDKLIFQTNAINYTQRHEHSIDINQITEVNFVDTMGFISNGLCVKTIKNGKEQFIVNERHIWKEQIEKIIAL